MTLNINAKTLLEAGKVLLLVSIFGLLVSSRPWQQSASTEKRKITVAGSSTIEALPDEYQFSPHFEQSGSDRQALEDSLTKTANEAIEGLKNLGVAEDDMKLDVSSYDNWYWRKGETGTIYAYITVKVGDKELAQKVQDYLLNSDAKGSLTAFATFSENKKKELDDQAVSEAIDDARASAELQAKKLDAKVGKVLTISQSSDSVFPVAYDSLYTGADMSVDSVESSLPVLTGQNEYTQSVTLTYELK